MPFIPGPIIDPVNMPSIENKLSGPELLSLFKRGWELECILNTTENILTLSLVESPGCISQKSLVQHIHIDQFVFVVQNAHWGSR